MKKFIVTTTINSPTLATFKFCKMNPNNITLESLNLNFEYEKLSREIDTLDDLDDVKNLAKYFMKMNFLQKEIVSKIGKI